MKTKIDAATKRKLKSIERLSRKAAVIAGGIMREYELENVLAESNWTWDMHLYLSVVRASDAESLLQEYVKIRDAK